MSIRDKKVRRKFQNLLESYGAKATYRGFNKEYGMWEVCRYKYRKVRKRWYEAFSK